MPRVKADVRKGVKKMKKGDQQAITSGNSDSLAPEESFELANSPEPSEAEKKGIDPEVTDGYPQDFSGESSKFNTEMNKTMQAKRRKLEQFIQESRDDSSQDECRASRMFSPATPLDSERGRSCKKAAMDFIKSVCLKGRRPSPTLIPFQPQLMTSESESRSNSPPPRKEVIIEIPDPQEEGKYIKVKDESKKIKFLKDCDLNPYCNLGEKAPRSKEEIEVFLCKDMLMKEFNKTKEKKEPTRPTTKQVLETNKNQSFEERRKLIEHFQTNFASAFILYQQGVSDLEKIREKIDRLWKQHQQSLISECQKIEALKSFREKFYKDVMNELEKLKRQVEENYAIQKEPAKGDGTSSEENI